MTAGQVACCTKGDPSIYCKPNAKNRCSPTVSVAKGMFYTWCPKINKANCQIQSTTKGVALSDSMTITATPSKLSFTKSNLQNLNYTDLTIKSPPYANLAALKTAKPDKFDHCYYILETPKYLYKSGTIKMKIK